MIKSFPNAAAEAAWARRFVKGVPNDIVEVANRKLMQIHNAALPKISGRHREIASRR